MALKIVVLCSSAAFYEHVNELADELEALGVKVLVPDNALAMRKSGNYDVVASKSWYKNPDDFTIKQGLMRGHFDKIAAGDMILVVNDEKHGKPGYIGSNVLMEMGLAFYLNKPIYVLYKTPEDAGFYEEVVGMSSIILGGSLDKLVKAAKN